MEGSARRVSSGGVRPTRGQPRFGSGHVGGVSAASWQTNDKSPLKARQVRVVKRAFVEELLVGRVFFWRANSLVRPSSAIVGAGRRRVVGGGFPARREATRSIA